MKKDKVKEEVNTTSTRNSALREQNEKQKRQRVELLAAFLDSLLSDFTRLARRDYSFSTRRLLVQHTAVNLIPFNRFEQGFKVTLSETFILLALNKFKEHRAKYGFRENLK